MLHSRGSPQQRAARVPGREWVRTDLRRPPGPAPPRPRPRGRRPRPQRLLAEMLLQGARRRPRTSGKKIPAQIAGGGGEWARPRGPSRGAGWQPDAAHLCVERARASAFSRPRGPPGPHAPPAAACLVRFPGGHCPIPRDKLGPHPPWHPARTPTRLCPRRGCTRGGRGWGRAANSWAKDTSGGGGPGRARPSKGPWGLLWARAAASAEGPGLMWGLGAGGGPSSRIFWGAGMRPLADGLLSVLKPCLQLLCGLQAAGGTGGRSRDTS